MHAPQLEAFVPRAGSRHGQRGQQSGGVPQCEARSARHGQREQHAEPCVGQCESAHSQQEPAAEKARVVIGQPQQHVSGQAQHKAGQKPPEIRICRVSAQQVRRGGYDKEPAAYGGLYRRIAVEMMAGIRHAEQRGQPAQIDEGKQRQHSGSHSRLLPGPRAVFFA